VSADAGREVLLLAFATLPAGLFNCAIGWARDVNS